MCLGQGTGYQLNTESMHIIIIIKIMIMIIIMMMIMIMIIITNSLCLPNQGDY